MSHALEDAFDRIEAFLLVNRGMPDGELPAAAARLQQAVGIDADARAVLVERLEGLGLDTRRDAVLLGVLLGLFAADADASSRRLAA